MEHNVIYISAIALIFVSLVMTVTTTNTDIGGSSFITCDLTGNWTSSHDASDRHPVHIKIHHNTNSGIIAVRADPWGASTGPGLVSNHTVSLVMVGAKHPSIGTISASKNPDFITGSPAPDCTWLSYGWCKFPYCKMKEPSPWWPFPTPPPTPPSPPTPSPAPHSCAWVPGTCPPPKWKPTYQMNLSTVVQPCNNSGYFLDGGKYGLTSFDWSNAKKIWSSLPNNLTNCSEMLVEQARVVKVQNSNTRVFVYRNFELALEWIRGQRTAMYDATKKDYFLQYQIGDKKGQLYNEPIKLHGLKQYFWDFRNPEAVDFFIKEVTGPDAIGSPYVDGFFTDDVRGIFEEHQSAPKNMGLNATQVHEIEDANQKAYTKILDAAIQDGGYNWQAFGAGDGTSKMLPTQKAGCANTMRKLCTAKIRDQPYFVTANFKTQGIASFLIVRGDYWWMGWGWGGCSDQVPHPHNSSWDIDVGSPRTNCTETSDGIFERNFTKGNAKLDCNSYTAELNFDYN